MPRKKPRNLCIVVETDGKYLAVEVLPEKENPVRDGCSYSWHSDARTGQVVEHFYTRTSVHLFVNQWNAESRR